MSTQSYTIEGMTCGHCAAAVTREVSLLAGVGEIAVDVAEGTLTLSAEDVTDEAIAAAVDEAGYTLLGRK